MFFYFR